MATISLQAAKVFGTISGNAPEVRVYPEAASQSFKAGQFVYLASGKVTVCGDDTTSILGMAVGDASTVTDTDCAVYIANFDTIFEMNVYHSSAGSAVTAITDVGGKKGLEVDSNKCYYALEEATALAFQVRFLSPRDAVGDTYGRVCVQVLSDIMQVGPGEKTA